MTRPAAIILAFALALSAPLALAAGEGQPARRKPTQSVSYVMVEPMYTTVIEGRIPRGLLLVEIGLDIPDAALRERVERELPRLRDAYIRSLMAYTAAAVRPWRQPDVVAIGDRIQKVTNHMLGREGARVLLAQTVLRITR